MTRGSDSLVLRDEWPWGSRGKLGVICLLVVFVVFALLYDLIRLRPTIQNGALAAGLAPMPFAFVLLARWVFNQSFRIDRKRFMLPQRGVFSSRAAIPLNSATRGTLCAIPRGEATILAASFVTSKAGRSKAVMRVHGEHTVLRREIERLLTECRGHLSWLEPDSPEARDLIRSCLTPRQERDLKEFEEWIVHHP